MRWIFAAAALVGVACGQSNMAAAQPPSSEAEAIATTKGLAQRDGLLLTLQPAKGAAVTFVDEDQCGNDDKPADVAHCLVYRLNAYLPEHHAFIVRNGAYETESYSWVSDQTGATAVIEGIPHYAPNGNRFVVATPNEGAGFNGIQLWRMENGLPVREWQYVPKEYALYDFAAWDGNTTIQFTASTYVNHELAFNLPARLVMDGNSGWHLEGPVEASR